MTKFTVSALALALAAGVVIADPQPGEKTPGMDKPKSVPATPLVKPTADPSTPKEKKAATLKVGDAAPALKIDAWVKGEEVKSLEAGKVYIVEFWATWCGPCIAGIPHLTKVQKENPEVTLISVAASERMPKEGKPDTRLEGVQKFVKSQGKAIGYRVAFDGDREMSKDWMQAAGQNGIPCSFIVGHDNKIAYIGHPSSMDAALAKAVKASQDAKKTASSAR